MSQIYRLKSRIDELIASKRLDKFKTYGEIGLKAGFMISIINENSPDDPARANSLRAAVKDVIGEAI